jgi:hypothetical protein
MKSELFSLSSYKHTMACFVNITCVPKIYVGIARVERGVFHAAYPANMELVTLQDILLFVKKSDAPVPL